MRITRRRIVLFVVVPLLAYFGVSSVNRALDTYSLQRASDDVRVEIDELQERNEELLRQREFLKTDEYVERIAREELDLVKPGETSIVVITPRDTIRPPRPGEPVVDEAPAPNWRRWWDYFFAAEIA